MTTATKAKQLTYAEAVRLNLEHMGTPSHEWRAVKVKGMAETTSPNGTPVSMPEFDFPAGYTAAPTLFPATSASFDGITNCELCNHNIKRVYHIQHDGNRWIMNVGSECVTHFAEGKNGAQVARQDINEANRELIRRVWDLKQSLRSMCTVRQMTRDSMGQQWERSFYDYSHPAGRFFAALKDGRDYWGGRKYNLGDWHNPPQFIDGIIPTPEKCHWNGEPIFTDRQITSWLKKHRPALEAFIAEVRETFPQIFA